MSAFTEPPILNQVEKKEIRVMMLKVMRDFRDLLTESINELDGEEELNDDSDFRTYEANQYSDFIYFYINLYDPGLSSFDAKCFWALDTGPRECCWQTLEKELSPELFAKIEAYLTANNKCSIKKNPQQHLDGNGCPKCLSRKEAFIANAKEVHGDKYDYSLVDWPPCNSYDCEQMKYDHIYEVPVTGGKEVRIKCPHHGGFEKKPLEHLLGAGCPYCGFRDPRSVQWSSSIHQFISKAREKHGYKYEYSDVVSPTGVRGVRIKCPHHGVLEVTPRAHLEGKGCCIPRCCEPVLASER